METSRQGSQKAKREGKRKFRNQRFSKSSRKKHLQSLAENKLGICRKVQDSTSSTENGSSSTNNSTVNQQTSLVSTPTPKAADPEPTPKRPRSELKLKCSQKYVVEVQHNCIEKEYTIVDIGVLEGVLNEACVCKVCKSGALSIMKQSHFGVVDKLKIMCNNIGCQTRTTFFTSKRSNIERKENSKGPTPFALNIRFALGMRCIGKGNRALNLFSSIINVSNGICQESYENLMAIIEGKTLELCQQSMNNAARDVRSQSNSQTDDIVDTACMFDGTWQRRGFSSLIGVVSCISPINYKVIDIEILRKVCKICQRLDRMDKTCETFMRLKENHRCQKNYEGSAPGMELAGTSRIFRRSIQNRKLRYIKYIGDGDSKSYDAIAAEKPYGEDHKIKKFECVGHVQKRVGTHLRDLRKITGNSKLADGKTLGGKGRLTLKEIDKLQLYYGLAI